MHTWTKEPPIVPGWYWYREKGKIGVAEVYKHEAYPRPRARLMHRDAMTSNWFGEWCHKRIRTPDEA